jgi:hypothetical protein
MVSLSSLWLPILLSSVLVFFTSFVIHMVLPYHRNDFGKAPSEGDLLDALRKAGVAPGDYVLPHAGGPSGMKSPEFQEKVKRGPVAVLTIVSGGFAMGRRLTQWFVYTIVVGIFAGYVTGHALGPGAHYLAVFRFVGTIAFVAYGLALWQDSIWHGRSWSTTLKSNFDSLVYGCLSAGVFGWLWPR